jgi:transcriptional regulator GlxA family with amidase domain
VADPTIFVGDSANDGSPATAMADSSTIMRDSAKEFSPSQRRLVDVTVVLLERGLPSTSLAPLEIFACAGALWRMLHGQPPEPRFRVRLVSIDGRATRHWVPVTVQPEGSLASVRRTDLIIVGAAELDHEASVRANAPLIPWLKRWHERGASICGICTGVSLLAEAALLDGRRATTHWGVVDQYRRLYPRVRWEPERFVTESGNILCGGGVYAAIDLSLYLVEKYCGHEIATQTAKALLLETPRISQASYAAHPPRSAHDDPAIQRVQCWLFQNFDKSVQIEELAARSGMSSRNFARRFAAATGETPIAYLHRLRIDAARNMLENRRKSIGDVGLAVGYEDEAFFRRLFKRHTGVAPRDYRARFGPRSAALRTTA